MSRRKQARPSKHLDDEDSTKVTGKEETSKAEGCVLYEDFFCCVFCSTRFPNEGERDKHELTCPHGSSASIHETVPNSCRITDVQEGTSRGIRRKRLEDSSDDDSEGSKSYLESDVLSEENDARASVKKSALESASITAPVSADGDSGNAASANSFLSGAPFPYSSPIANANVTLDALQKTKMAIAQFAAAAMANNGQQSPAALQELAVLQSTLYALQQQQLMQLQLIQQLSQQLQISHSDASSVGGDSAVTMFSKQINNNEDKEQSSSTSPSATPIPATETSPANQDDVREQNSVRSHISSGAFQADTEDSRITGDVTDTSKPIVDPPGSPQSTNINCNPTSSALQGTFSLGNCGSSILSQFPGGTLADAILQTTEPPPAPDAPSTLEMLQRTAQQVLNNASQGLLATNLADELGFRANGGNTGDGKKDQSFKHRCRYCGKVFSSDSALQIHIRSHTGERPFKCNICGNRFTTKGNLKVHFQRHTARFPHIKMNPHPVPEHLDKFHPPLLSQLELEEAKTPPPSSGGSVTPVNAPANFPGVLRPPAPNPVSGMNPHSDPIVANNSFSLTSPLFSPVQASREQLHSPKKSQAALKESPSIPVIQEFPENLKKVDLNARESASKNTENADDESSSMKVPSRNSNLDPGDNDNSEICSGRDSRLLSQDDFSDDSRSLSQDFSKNNKNNSSFEVNKDSSFQIPEDTSGRQSTASNNSSPSSTLNVGPLGSALPFPPSLNFAPHLPPTHFRFPFAFPLPGALPVFPHGIGPRENPHVPVVGLQSAAAPVMLPRDVDPSKDPAIYTNLLPRPGSNDNAWESLIEVTKTSETSKLQQLVDNIDNKVVDPNECVVCHRVLSCKSALQMHYRTHTGERPFKCKICSRAFTTKGNLKTHMGVHRAKPPARMMHICPVCHKKFINGLVLQQHIRLHTGEPTDLTPEQIQAAELRDFPTPFPFVGGFHPFMPHGPIPSLHLPHQPFPVNLAAANLMKQPEVQENNPEGEFSSEERSSSIPSPTSSISSNHHRSLPNDNVDVETTSSQSQNPEDFVRTSNESEEMDTNPRTIKSEINTDEEENYDNRIHESRPNREHYYNWLSSLPNRSQGSPGPLPEKFEQETTDATPPLFNPFHVMSSPPKGMNSSLSTLAASATMTQPTFNPLNLPLTQGRGNTTCNICLKTFACHSALEIHYRSHTKERPFKCNVCDRGFTTKGNMKQHMMTHKNRDGESAEKTPVHRDDWKKSKSEKSSAADETKAHCLSLTIQHSGHEESPVRKIKDEPNLKDQNRSTSLTPERHQVLPSGIIHTDFQYGVSALGAHVSSSIAALQQTNTESSLYNVHHRPSTSRGALPVPPGPLP